MTYDFSFRIKWKRTSWKSILTTHGYLKHDVENFYNSVNLVNEDKETVKRFTRINEYKTVVD